MTPAQTTLPRLDESLLTHMPPFSKLNRRQIRDVLNLATSRHYDAGVTIFDEGMPAERFYMLLDGHIRVARTTETGDHVTVLHIPSGQLFGIAQALKRDTYPATAVTASESIALSWPMRLWNTFVEEYDGFATETYGTVGRRIAEMNDRIIEMTTQQVEQRVANALLRLIKQSGREVEGGIEIDFPVTRQDISEVTGTTLHTVSRLLSVWEKDGIVESRRKRIKVCEPHRLVRLGQL
jgi:CRP-like cAMP-binding protein